MHRSRLPELVCLLPILLGGCAPRLPLRGASEIQLSSPSAATTPEQRSSVENASVEIYPSVSLSVIEFTDQGKPARAEQLTRAFDLTDATLAKESDALFVLFVHGWGHSAATSRSEEHTSELQSLAYLV